MKKENNQLKKSSLVLMTIAGISLFMMLAFFSSSLFGGGKGTYSAKSYFWRCPSGLNNTIFEVNTMNETKGYCCPSNFPILLTDVSISEYFSIHNSTRVCVNSIHTPENHSKTSARYCNIEFEDKDDCESKGGSFSAYMTGSSCSVECATEPISAEKVDAVSYTLTLDSNGGKFVGNTNNSILNSIINNSNRTELTLTSDNDLIECNDQSCSFSFVSFLVAERDGYQFKGWGTSNSCTSNETTSTITFSNDVTYYACWQKTIKVYGINGSSDYQEIPCKKQDGSNLYVTENVDAGTNSNKHFEGWSPNSICNPIVIEQKNASFTCSGNSYYACWSDVGNSSGGSTNECTFKIKIPSGASPSNIWHSYDYTYSGNLYLNKDSSSSVGNGGLQKYVIPPTGKCFTGEWIVTGSKNDTYSTMISEEDGDCGIELTPQFGSCNSGGSGGGNGGGTGNDPTPSSSSSSSSPKPSSASSSSEAEYEELDSPYDKCYNKKWVRVVSCQPDGTGAKCKLSTGETVDKAAVSKAGVTGCDVPKDAFDYPVDGDRCNMATGKIVHIDSCQTKAKVIGAHCKDKDGNYILVDNLAVKENGYCKDDRSSIESSSDDPANQDVDKSVQTGTTAFVLSWIAGIIALVISFYYFRKNYFVKQ